MNTAQKQRDYLFDNYKVLLIFLVVTGHFIGPSIRDNDFLLILKWIIVSFHMPAFIFISGYFSKKTLSLKTLIQKLAVPYLVYEIIYYLFYTFVMHKETGLLLWKPKFTLWYLMVLFFYRIITPYVKKIPYYMILTILAGLLIGFSNMENNFLSIPRALVFFPYFLAGTCFDKATLAKLRGGRKERRTAAVCMGIIVIVLTVIGLFKFAPMQIFYGRYNYLSMRQTMAEGVLWRIFSYGVGFLMTYGIMSFLSDKKNCLSYIGTRTMAVYLFHGLTYSYLEYCTPLLEGVDTVWKTILLLLLCAGITLFFSWKPFTVFTNAVSNISINMKKRTA